MVKNTNINGTAKAAAQAETLASILNGRSGTHGDAFENLEDIARRWSNYLKGKKELDAADVAYMMVEMKLSRATYGDNEEVDHFRDMMGYAAIGAAYLDHRYENQETINN